MRKPMTVRCRWCKATVPAYPGPPQPNAPICEACAAQDRAELQAARKTEPSHADRLFGNAIRLIATRPNAR
jgi:hypothetical protein